MTTCEVHARCAAEATSYDCDGYPTCAEHAEPCDRDHDHPAGELAAQYARHMHAGNPSRLG